MTNCSLFLTASPLKRDSTAPLECGPCKKFIAAAVGSLPADPTQRQITVAIEAVCGFLPAGDEKKQCKVLLFVGGNELPLYMMSERDPTKVCLASTACH